MVTISCKDSSYPGEENQFRILPMKMTDNSCHGDDDSFLDWISTGEGESLRRFHNEEEAPELFSSLASRSECADSDHTNNSQKTNTTSDGRLVVQEDRYVHFLSFAVILVLIVVSVLTTTVIYVWSSQEQASSFENDYHTVAENLIERFRYEIGQHLLLAQGVATVIVQALISEQQRTNSTAQDVALTLQLPRWEDLTRVPRITGALRQIAWNPLVFNVSQQMLLEQSIRDERRSPSSYIYQNSNRNPPCFLCDNNPLLGYVNRDDVDVNNTRPGRPPKTCGAIDDDGRQGMFLPRACPNLQRRHSNKTCICGPLPAEAATPVTATSTTLDLPSRLFYCNGTSGALELWNDAKDDDEKQGSSHPFPWTVVRYLYAPGVPETVPTTLWVHNSLNERETTLQKLMRFQRPVVAPTTLTKACEGRGADEISDPRTTIFAPVSLAPDDMVGVVSMEFLWSQFLTSTYPPNSEYVEIVIESSCGDEAEFHTFGVAENLSGLSYRGTGDLHERRFSDWQHSTEFLDFYTSAYQARPRFAGNDPVVGNISIDDPFAYQQRMESEPDYCNYRFLVYPTTAMESKYLSQLPFNSALVSGAIFLFTSLLFAVYLWMVQRRQENVMETAQRTNAIVVSLFPSSVRDRLYQRQQRRGGNRQHQEQQELCLHSHSNHGQRSFLADGDELPHSSFGLEPIADFFPHATVMFLDLCGFTAWSSEREPCQVFQLLETLYAAFDELAKRMGVFKVETIGDCYVAVCGLPEPNDRHAIIMTKFAFECLSKVAHLTKELVSTMGPSMSDIKARVGLHSGPLTAGVLRGDKARFQLFGDSVNTCSRLESSSMPYRIHSSKATAELLKQMGKESWITPRNDRITLKGKGEMETFWLNPSSRNTSGNEGPMSAQIGTIWLEETPEDLTQRLVSWIVTTVLEMLEKVVQERHRECLQEEGTTTTDSYEMSLVDEVVSVLDMPLLREETKTIPPKCVQGKVHVCRGEKSTTWATTKTTLNSKVREELHDYVTEIATMYRRVPFHNFEHASHVVMSARKFLRRIVSPAAGTRGNAKDIFNQTYGISDDPLMQFAVIFACLIHDVDHTGFSNQELIQQELSVAKQYHGKTVAEQHSFNISWKLLLAPSRFQHLRRCLFPNQEEQTRFRQLLLNAVIATDIADKSLKENRERRWNEAFSTKPNESQDFIRRRKATIVFEYVLQASDVAHTMQHWHSYQKFNARLFEERYVAWMAGVAPEPPSTGWYDGEIKFFDFYVIPLATRLKTCGVFGVSHDECLNYASENRQEWVRKGPAIVALLTKKCERKYGILNKTQ